MRRAIATVMTAALALGAVALPATAGKKKATRVHESMAAQLAPFPKLSAMDPTGEMNPGCTAGVEDVHWKQIAFTSPGKGTLRFYMEGFEGDWDIYVFDATGTVLARGDQAQVNVTSPTTPAPPEEEILLPMTKGQEVFLAMCNWMGAPDGEAHYEGTFR